MKIPFGEKDVGIPYRSKPMVPNPFDPEQVKVSAVETGASGGFGGFKVGFLNPINDSIVSEPKKKKNDQKTTVQKDVAKPSESKSIVNSSVPEQVKVSAVKTGVNGGFGGFKLGFPDPKDDYCQRAQAGEIRSEDKSSEECRQTE